MADRHVSFLAAAAPVTAAGRRRPLMVGAMLAGLVLGGTGLATALPGSLPKQASSVARSALAAVNLVDGKESTPRTKAKAGRFTLGCTVGTPPTAFTGNHGQYVKAHPDDPATPDVNERAVAAQSDCGKPLSSVGKEDAAPGDAANSDKDPKPGKEAKPDKPAKPEKAGDDDEATGSEGAGKPADAGRPESPGKSEEEHPPTTAAKEQGSENPSTDTANPGNAGKPDDRRPDGVGGS